MIHFNESLMSNRCSFDCFWGWRQKTTMHTSFAVYHNLLQMSLGKKTHTTANTVITVIHKSGISKKNNQRPHSVDSTEKVS